MDREGTMTQSGSGADRRRALRRIIAAAGLSLSVAVVPAQPTTGLVTRQGQAIGDLEQALLDAMMMRDRALLDRLLDDGFEMIIAQAPDQPIDREAWIDSVAHADRTRWRLDQVMVRDLGPVAVASLVLRPLTGSRPPVFVVDTWQHEAAQWRLLTRHASLALGSRRSIPGDAAARSAPKKY
jgi:hypothetical protein